MKSLEGRIYDLEMEIDRTNAKLDMFIRQEYWSWAVLAICLSLLIIFWIV
jgi:hypothetical protein